MKKKKDKAQCISVVQDFMFLLIIFITLNFCCEFNTSILTIFRILGSSLKKNMLQA